MAVRPVFIPTLDGDRLVNVEFVEFEWFPGLSKTQKQKSIDSLHQAANKIQEINPLEISSKAKSDQGVNLSAFNLGYQHPRTKIITSVESAFQASKVFENGGPFPELLSSNSREAKAFIGSLKIGGLVYFNFYGQQWELRPLTAFYDWLYLQSLFANSKYSSDIIKFNAFTDIEFNPKKSINCQAYSAALFVSLKARNELDHLLENRLAFIERLEKQPEWIIGSPYEKYHPHAGDLLSKLS